MARLSLILFFTLQFKAGISGRAVFLYNRPGQDAILPCATDFLDKTCSIVTWLYNRNLSQYFVEVVNGNVLKRSARAARLSVNTDCSLVINSVTAEDAGFYTCRQGRTPDQDVDVFLSVLTISPSPADADPKRDDEVTLECSLSRHSDVIPCQQNSIRWINETGAELLGEGVGYKVIRQTDCVSVLTVKRQSGINRRYTCQFTDKNKVEIETDYTPDFTDPTGWSPLSYVMLTLRIAGLILMIIITVLVIRITWNTKALHDDSNVNNDGDVQYENVEGRPADARLH